MKVRRGLVMGAAAISVVGMVAAYRLGRARADGVPAMNPLYYGGVLDDGGRPAEGTRNVTVRLWDAATAGATVCTTTAGGTTFSGGRFRVALDATCVGAVRANPELWAELQVDATRFPRSKLGAVPYALEAGRASAAAGALEARLAAVEGRSASARQVAIGEWTFTPYVPSNMTASPARGGYGVAQLTCPSYGFQTLANPASLTFVAAVGGVFRVSTWVQSDDYAAYFRIFSSSGVASIFPAFARGNDSTAGSGIVRVESLYRLDGGRTYTFSLQVDVSCPAGASRSVNIHSPLVVEQLD